MSWQTMETAPKDRPILAWCGDSADNRVFLKNIKICDRCAPDGYNIIEWRDFENLETYSELLDGWFTTDKNYDTPADPVAWCAVELPAPLE